MLLYSNFKKTKQTDCSIFVVVQKFAVTFSRDMISPFAVIYCIYFSFVIYLFDQRYAFSLTGFSYATNCNVASRLSYITKVFLTLLTILLWQAWSYSKLGLLFRLGLKFVKGGCPVGHPI